MSREATEKLYREVRWATEALCQPLAIEDYVLQSMPEASPTRWHLAHTSWFFETFLLGPKLPGYQPLDARYASLFNSYYHAAGDRFPQPRRGLLSRPTVKEVFAYRRHVDRAMERLIDGAPEELLAECAFLIELGLNHEEQHQELILTDLKHAFAANPLAPVYQSRKGAPQAPKPPLRWISFSGGLIETGASGDHFTFDNERPRHPVYLAPFELASRLVTSGEFLDFIRDGGYARPDLWLSDGWDIKERQGWRAPLYWEERGGRWWQFTLSGLREIEPEEPVCHISYYEAEAFARWAGARLPSEAEWELAASQAAPQGNLLERGLLHPAPAAEEGLCQLFGDAWEWTASPYLPYPGYAPFPGALGEYNGKFMSNRMVLRGGSCATPARHIRASYRNFFVPETRWQFSGLRLARGR